MKGPIILLLLLAVVSCQIVEKLVIDDFSLGADSQRAIVALSNNIQSGDPPVIENAVFSLPECGDTLIGCGRDLQVKVTRGLSGRSFESGIFSGYTDNTWAVANPKSSSATYTLQYDGTDSNILLDTRGLGGVNLTQNAATEIALYVLSIDLDVTYNIQIFDLGDNLCQTSLFVPTTSGPSDSRFSVPASSFTGCDLDSIGAIQFILSVDDPVDILVKRITFEGPMPSPTPTRTPTPLPAPSEAQTRTPTPSPAEPSASQTPTQPPSSTQTTTRSQNPLPIPQTPSATSSADPFGPEPPSASTTPSRSLPPSASRSRSQISAFSYLFSGTFIEFSSSSNACTSIVPFGIMLAFAFLAAI